MQRELVLRNDTTYFRTAPDRSAETADYNRLRTLVAFGEGAQAAYGGTFEEVIASVQESMREMPPPQPKIKKVIELDYGELARLKYEMLKKGIKKVRISNSQIAIFEGRALKEISV